MLEIGCCVDFFDWSDLPDYADIDDKEVSIPLGWGAAL